MRLQVVHEIAAVFEPALAMALREIRMSPRTFDGQYVGNWRIDVDHDCRVDRAFDAYGNVLHDFSVSGPLRNLTVTAAGEVEVDDTAGVLQASSRERVPPGLFLRETGLTRSDAAIRGLAKAAKAAGTGGTLDACHALLHLVNDALTAEAPTAADLIGTASEEASAVLARGHGSPTAAAHVFIAAARAMDVPARFVSGYLWRGDERDAGGAIYAWAEAYVERLGWVGFDALEDRCPTDAYVRVAACLDQQGAAWMRGADYGEAEAQVTARASITKVDF